MRFDMRFMRSDMLRPDMRFDMRFMRSDMRSYRMHSMPDRMAIRMATRMAKPVALMGTEEKRRVYRRGTTQRFGYPGRHLNGLPERILNLSLIHI